MKSFTLCFFLILVSHLQAQSLKNGLDALINAEKISAKAKINFVANSNTQNYDIIHHKLEFTVNPEQYFISGTVSTTFKALSNLQNIAFDLSKNMIVSKVTQNGEAVFFEHNSNSQLIINLKNSLLTSQMATLVIEYAGAPSKSNNAFRIATHGNDKPVLFTLSEPFGPSDWWPCKQDLNDKIDSVDVYITAPTIYTSVSNGLQINSIDNLNSTKTTHFKHKYPIPAYLIAIAASNYSIYTQTAGTSPNLFPIVNYLYPENFDNSVTEISQTLPIMNFFEKTFEVYPFAKEKYGHAECKLNGGMEHTTVSFMGFFDKDLIAHELAHQWFGNKITCGSWKDIWLNESFATYLTWLYNQNLQGNDIFNTYKLNAIKKICSQRGGSVYVSDNDSTNAARIFDSRLTYNKGAMVLNMLRLRMGDVKFFDAIKNYLSDPKLAFKFAKTGDLKFHFEKVYGKDLTEFFDDWVFKEGYPTYNITAQNTNKGDVRVVVEQGQSHPSVNFFESDIPIRFFGENGEIFDFLINNTKNGEIFDIKVPFLVTKITIDPNYDLISDKNTTRVISDILDTKTYNLYPNPVSDFLNLDLNAGEILKKLTIQNAIGQTVFKSSKPSPWNISFLTTGVYFFTIETNLGTKKIKFIKL